VSGRPGPRRLGEALDAVVASVAPATLLASVQGVWSEAAGAAVAAEAQPVAERDGVVTFACSSGVWAQELELLSQDLLERLREALGGPGRGAERLRGLRFTAGGRRRPA
jgi:predicted nucleic acid-binding Zn ribbon protein